MENLKLLHLHTYFFFPFAVNSAKVMSENQEHWVNTTLWLDGFERWLQTCASPLSKGVRETLGKWQREPYVDFSLDGAAYADMVFFHPFVRHVFFDAHAPCTDPTMALLRCYTLTPHGKKVTLRALNERGVPHAVEVTDLRLFLFANGVGILSIGVEARNISARDALWVNEMMRKVYPSSGRQRREGRAPSKISMWVEEQGEEKLVAEEGFDDCSLIGLDPPLSNLVQGLLYFLNYENREYEQILDERMIVYSYAAIDPSSAPPDFLTSEHYQQLISRFLYVDRIGAGYRYDPEFTEKQMRRHLYTRWAHEGTYYGYTSYSSVTISMGADDRGKHKLREGFLIHRMFNTRYYLMAIIALFYRATLLMFNEKTALVSRDLYHDEHKHQFRREHIDAAQHLRAEYLHFSNYWFFEELSNKDEEVEHYDMQAREYRLDGMKAEIENELEALNASLSDYYQVRNTSAVNRLAMLSLIFGAAAVVTGFFGMNFAGGFERFLFSPTFPLTHYAAVAAVTLFSIGAVLFGVFVILRNWGDYGKILTPMQSHNKRGHSSHPPVVR